MKLREEEFYEQYHQHGGTTIIPTEIFNELYDDATEEIERLKKLCDKYEEEHNNEFQCWKRDRKELLNKRVIIEKAIEYIKSVGVLPKQIDSFVLLDILKGSENSERIITR